jgi:Invasin, domain 3
MKKFTILAGLMALALVIGVAGTTLRTGTAQARPTDVISFSPDVCFSFVVNELVDKGDTDLAVAAGRAITDCYATAPDVGPPVVTHGGLYVTANLEDLANVLDGDPGDADTYSILADRTAGQLGQDGSYLRAEDATHPGQALWVLTFTGNSEPVTLNADVGEWLSTNLASSDSASLTPNADLVTADVLVGTAIPDSKRGDTEMVTASQQGFEETMDYTIVGAPDGITIAATKTTIQSDSELTDCSLSDFTDVIGKPTIAGLTATVTDEDDNELTGIQVIWDSSDSDNATLAVWQGDGDTDPVAAGVQMHEQRTSSYTIASSGAVIAPNLACGQDTGTSTFDAALAIDKSNDDEIDITVVGAPDSMTLAASPASIACNGINSSEVSATLLDADGKAVVAGNKVHFEVVALGTANPIIAETDANGVAKTTVVPLSGVTAGVTVLVSVVGNTDIEQNILVSCTPAVPIVVPPTVPPTINVGPPNTGDGGYLP